MKNYKAEWRIIEDKLYLSNIYSYNYVKDNYKADLDSSFSNYKDGLVLADWYTGNLFIPKKEHIWLGVSPGFPVYESEWKISIIKGGVINKALTSNNYHQFYL